MSKERITITLASTILAKIDQLVDKKTIRNRSHAIESILSQHILSRVTKVVILAAGKGVNMRPLTYELPKSMIPVYDKPLLAHTIESLARTGLKELIIVTGHLGSKIQDEFKDGQRYGVSITYVEDHQETGTAQALKSVEEQVGNDPFLLIYGDVLAEIDWLQFIDFHDYQQASITMAVTTKNETDSWGMVRMEGNHVVEVREKSSSDNSSHMINSGLFVVDPSVLKEIGSQSVSFEKDLLSKIALEKKLLGYHFSGKWFDIGSPEDYERALREWQS